MCSLEFIQPQPNPLNFDVAETERVTPRIAS